MITINCTEEVYNTIYTSLRLELEKNWGKDEDVVKLLKTAIEAVQASMK